MAAYKIHSLTQRNLAPPEALRYPEYYEWRDIAPPPDGTLESSGLKGLRICCANCGWTVQGNIPPTSQGFSVCPDCDELLFQAKQLFERKTVNLPDFRIRQTKSRYIHIDGWQHLKDATVYYTCNKQDPSAADSRFTRPFKPDFDEDMEIRAVCYWGESKSQVASMVFSCSIPAVSYSCRFCQTQVTGRGDVIACPTCGAIRKLQGNGEYTEDEAPWGFACSSCGGHHLERGVANGLHCRNCGAEYGFTVEWVFRGWRITCPACGQPFLIQQPNSSDGICSCPSCRSALAFDAQNGKCWKALPAPPQQPHRKLPPVPQPPTAKKKKDNDGCGCLILIAIVIFILVCVCS